MKVRNAIFHRRGVLGVWCFAFGVAGWRPDGKGGGHRVQSGAPATDWNLLPTILPAGTEECPILALVTFHLSGPFN